MNGQTGKFVGDLPMDKSAYWRWFGIWAAIPIGWALADLTGLGYYLLRRTKLLGGMEKTEI